MSGLEATVRACTTGTLRSHAHRLTRMVRVGLVPCGRRKAPWSAPARELYVSQLFRVARQYAQAH